jgi:retinoblastoma-associated protein
LLVIEALADKEGRKNDKITIEKFMQIHGRESRILTFRILDELLLKEQRNSLNPAQDFSSFFFKDIFLKSVLICALECVLFIHNVRDLQVDDVLKLVGLSAFDYWRILNSFLKFDPTMPRVLINHFREIEVRIVSQTAWQNGSPVVEIIKDLCNTISKPASSASNQIEEERLQEQIMQPYNMFFKRVLHLAAQRIFELTDLLSINEDIKERIWSVMKVQLSTEPQLLHNRHLDQLVMCTVYSVCKVCQPGSPITFNNIITKYADMFKT